MDINSPKESVWKTKPEDKISKVEFAYDIQLTSLEFSTLKEVITRVFKSIVVRERCPLRRTILLGRVLQNAGMMLEHEAVLYNLNTVVTSTVK